MDSAELINRAQSRRESLLAELQELDLFIRFTERLMNPEPFPLPAVRASNIVEPTVEPIEEKAETKPANEKKAKKPARSPKNRRPRNGIQAKTIAAVESIIEKTGSPVTTEDLLAQLGAREIRVAGKSPRTTLHARLHGVPSLVYNRSSGWNLRSFADNAGANLI